MAPKSNKFGAFGGVFVPSILTILGVIMYLRLPRLVGEGGLYEIVGIIVAAHVISITTGLSISSIATDKKVGAGGPYYIVSRSLGLPIGGTLGLALFVGLAFSISLYIIGFCESFLPTVGMAATPETIRIWGTVVLVIVSIITLVSTSLALKMQYVILALIVLSVGSIALGHSGEATASPILDASKDAPSFALLFGIFFPAVTGFTAGVNMSGDLADPKRAIPLGTLLSIVTGLVVYVGLAIFIAYRVPAAQLSNPTVLVDIALVPVLVLGGIWGATISSAMGSILGAPRILQALSEDRVTPRFFAKGAGKTNEPRRALILAALIAETGILVGELDAIARIVSMFFIATYGFLNLSCAIESWVRTDFRPTFKIPRMVSVIGGVSCLLVMIQLDLAAAIGAMVLFVGLFFVLKRRELSLESGDAWGGVWFSMVRSNLERLRQHPAATGDYRPNILAFSWEQSAARPQLIAFGALLVSRLGMLTDVVFQAHGRGQAPGERPHPSEEEDAGGIFQHPVVTDDPEAMMRSMVNHYGFAGLVPNTVLLGWTDHRQKLDGLLQLLEAARQREQSTIIWAPRQGRTLPPPTERQVDVWWSRQRGSFSFALALMRILTGDEPWHLARVRFLLINDNAANAEVLHWTALRLCREARLAATVKVLNAPTAEHPYEEWVRRGSVEADLVVIALPGGDSIATRTALESFEPLAAHLGHAALLCPSPSFPNALGSIAAAEPQEEVEGPAHFSGLTDDDLPELVLPGDTQLSAEVVRVSTALDQIAEDLSSGALAPMFRGHQQLLKRVEGLIATRFDQLERTLSGSTAKRKRGPQVEASLLRGAIELIEHFETLDLSSYRAALQQRIDDLPAALAEIRRGLAASEMSIVRPKTGDQPARGRVIVLAEWLLDYQLDQRLPVELEGAFEGAASAAMQTAMRVSRALTAARLNLATLVEGSNSDTQTLEGIAIDKATALEDLAEIGAELEARWNRTRQRCHRAVRQVVQDYADDLQRTEGRRWVRRERRIPKEAREHLPRLTELPRLWFENETLVMRWTRLDAVLSGFQGRMVGIARKVKSEVQVQLSGGSIADLGRRLAALNAIQLERGGETHNLADLRLTPSRGLDAGSLIDDAMHRIEAATDTLPETFTIPTEQGLAKLDVSPLAELEPETIEVRRLVTLTVQRVLVDELRRSLKTAAGTEASALAAIRDVHRLMLFSQTELAGEDEKTYLTRMETIVADGRTRLEHELEEVRALMPDFELVVHGQLERMFELTSVAMVANTGEHADGAAEAEGLSHRAVGRAREVVGALSEVGREAMTGLLYRRSAGVVLAQQLRGGLSAEEILVEGAMELAEACSPRPEILEHLPFFYQHAFLGKSRTSESFWVGGEAELAEAHAAIERNRKGSRGALIVTGARNSGKSALCQVVAAKACTAERVHHIHPPAGGTGDPEGFERELRAVLGGHGDTSALITTLPERSAIVLHDVELWWQRCPGGLRTLERIQRLIEQHSGSALFILNVNTHALRFLNRVFPLTDQALALIECNPVDARVLRDIIMLRHRTTGIRLRLDDLDEAELTQWRLARLFNQHFRFSGGNVGVALQSWIAGIQKSRDKTLTIEAHARPNAEVLHELPMELVALLIEFILHRQVTVDRLEEITGLRRSVLQHQVDTLRRMRLIDADPQGTLEINRYLEHIVRAHLLERGLLA